MKDILKPQTDSKYSAEISQSRMFIEELGDRMAQLGCDAEVLTKDGPWFTMLVNGNDINVGIYEDTREWNIDIPHYGQLAPRRLMDAMEEIVGFCRPLTEDDLACNRSTEEACDGIYSNYI